MIDIRKLARLTALQLSPRQEALFSQQLEEVVDMLDQIKNTSLPKPQTTRHGLLGLQTIPSDAGSPDVDLDRILTNVAHPILGHAIEVKGFVE